MPSSTDSSIQPQKRDPYAALRCRDVRLLLSTSLLSVISGKIQFVALGYELYHRTGEYQSLGWLALALGVPMLFLGLFAGQLSDLYDRKRILMFSQSCSILTSVALFWIVFGKAPNGLIYACALMRGICATFGGPARQSLLPQITPAGVLPNAVTWSSTTFNTAMVVGPALGGFVIALPEFRLAQALLPGFILENSVACAFAVDAIFLTGALLMVSRVRRPPPAPAKDPVSLKSLGAGFRFVWNAKVILAAVSLDMFAVMLGGANYLFPVFQKDILKVNATGLGYMEAAPALGAILMALLLAHLPPLKRAGRTMLWAVAGFGAATIVFGLSKSLPLSLAALFFAGVFDMVSVVVRHTLVQSLAPEEMRGRISAVNSMFIGASNEMGGVESAFVAAWLGPVASVVIGGFGSILVAATVAVLSPGIRRIGSLHDLKTIRIAPQ